MRLSTPHCPSCGGPIDVPRGARHVACSYCSAGLTVHDDHVSTEVKEEDPATPSRSEPNATLWTTETKHFQLSLMEQRVTGVVPELFRGVSVDDERFAFVSLRVVDRDGRPVDHPLDAAFNALHASLLADGDPGLAANLA